MTDPFQDMLNPGRTVTVAVSTPIYRSDIYTRIAQRMALSLQAALNPGRIAHGRKRCDPIRRRVRMAAIVRRIDWLRLGALITPRGVIVYCWAMRDANFPSKAFPKIRNAPLWHQQAIARREPYLWCDPDTDGP